MTANLQALLQQGFNHHNAGNLEAAEACYREILRHKPSHPDANNLLGMVAFQVGRTEQAIPLIAKAIKKGPKVADYHRNMGVVQAVLGHADKALLSFRKALSIKPDFAEVHFNIGNVQNQRGKPEEALAAYEKAIKFNPGYVEAHENMAVALLVLGRTRDCVDTYKRVLELTPQSARAYLNLGTALARSTDYEDAIAALEKALRLDPDLATAHNNLGNVLRAQGKFDEATSSYKQALKLEPDYFEAMSNLGGVLGEAGQMDEAVKYCQMAAQGDADNAEAHFNLAGALAETGQMDDAADAYRRVIQIKPDYGEAHHQLMQIQKQTAYNDDIKTMESLYHQGDIPQSEKMFLAFGLGKAFEDLGEFDKAFDCLLDANRIKRQSYSYSIDQDRDIFRQTTDIFDAAFFRDHTKCGNPDTTPIFILGMPRSGTSLVEQILASHPLVTGGGELTELAWAYGKVNKTDSEFPKSVKALSPEDFNQLGTYYLQKLRAISSDTPHITDKLPHNFANIGLIRAALPNARIIHCRRDPVDTCLSIFKNYFIDSHPYAYDLKELGAYYNLYASLMDHWQNVAPGGIYDIQYEDLVSDTETQVRHLLAACDLPFDPACLSFHKTKRQVKTVSVSQVRKPIYRDSVRLWQRYEKQLSPLRAELEQKT